MGRDLNAFFLGKPLSDFNSRARMGRDDYKKYFESVSCISIHAPAWGATGDLSSIFIPVYNFNSRARMGRDHCIQTLSPKLKISIHAPAWGATSSFFSDAIKNRRFQFTRPHGARLEFSQRKLYHIGFQFTRPHGARHYYNND